MYNIIHIIYNVQYNTNNIMYINLPVNNFFQWSMFFRCFFCRGLQTFPGTCLILAKLNVAKPIVASLPANWEYGPPVQRCGGQLVSRVGVARRQCYVWRQYYRGQGGGIIGGRRWCYVGVGRWCYRGQGGSIIGGRVVVLQGQGGDDIGVGLWCYRGQEGGVIGGRVVVLQGWCYTKVVLWGQGGGVIGCRVVILQGVWRWCYTEVVLCREVVLQGQGGDGMCGRVVVLQEVGFWYYMGGVKLRNYYRRWVVMLYGVGLCCYKGDQERLLNIDLMSYIEDRLYLEY